MPTDAQPTETEPTEPGGARATEHARWGAARRRVDALVDPGTFRERAQHHRARVVTFPLPRPYADTVAQATDRTGETEAVVVGTAAVHGVAVAVGAFGFDFMGGTLGTATGDRLVDLYDAARNAALPVVLATASGGVRVQEGVAALIQMPRVAAAAERHRRAGLLQVVLLDDPTKGGVAAGFALVADVLVSSPGARVGFTGGRISSSLGAGPDGTDAEVGASGVADVVVPVGQHRAVVAALLATTGASRSGPSPVTPSEAGASPATPSPAGSRGPGGGAAGGAAIGTAVEAAAVPPVAGVPAVTGTVGALAGRLLAAVDRAVVTAGSRTGLPAAGVGTGFAEVDGTAFAWVALGEQTSAEAAVRPGPGAYAKVSRHLRLAERLGLAVVTIIDSAGADSSPEADRANVAGAIAETCTVHASLEVPTCTVLAGRAGSGGAMALAGADRVVAGPEVDFYVLPPAAMASLLLRDPTRADEVARHQATGPEALLAAGMVDEVVDLDPAALRLVLTGFLTAPPLGARHARWDRVSRGR